MLGTLLRALQTYTQQEDTPRYIYNHNNNKQPSHLHELMLRENQ